MRLEVSCGTSILKMELMFAVLLLAVHTELVTALHITPASVVTMYCWPLSTKTGISEVFRAQPQNMYQCGIQIIPDGGGFPSFLTLPDDEAALSLDGSPMYPYVDLSIMDTDGINSDFSFAMYIKPVSSSQTGGIFTYEKTDVDVTQVVAGISKFSLRHKLGTVYVTASTLTPEGHTLTSVLLSDDMALAYGVWNFVSVNYMRSNGRVQLYVKNEVSNTFKQAGTDGVMNTNLRLPGSIRLGADKTDISVPTFEGSILCFGLFAEIVTAGMDATIQERCQDDSEWAHAVTLGTYVPTAACSADTLTTTTMNVEVTTSTTAHPTTIFTSTKTSSSTTSHVAMTTAAVAEQTTPIEEQTTLLPVDSNICFAVEDIKMTFSVTGNDVLLFAHDSRDVLQCAVMCVYYNSCSYFKLVDQRHCYLFHQPGVPQTGLHAYFSRVNGC